MTLDDKEVLPVLEGEAPAAKDAVGEALGVLEADTVVLGVDAGVPLGDPVGDPVGVGVGVGAAVALPDCEALPVVLALAPRDSDAVGEALVVEEAESVDDGVGEGEDVALAVGEPVPLTDTV